MLETQVHRGKKFGYYHSLMVGAEKRTSDKSCPIYINFLLQKIIQVSKTKGTSQLAAHTHCSECARGTMSGSQGCASSIPPSRTHLAFLQLSPTPSGHYFSHLCKLSEFYIFKYYTAHYKKIFSSSLSINYSLRPS